MMYGAFQCLLATKPASRMATTSSSSSSTLADNIDTNGSKSLRIKSACLFFSYAISVFAGGYAHYNYHGVDDLNTTSFRILWTICVGSVTAAGGFMGACGSEIYKRMNLQAPDDKVRFRMVHLHDILWTIYGGYMTWICITGAMSYKRPACDIFVAGTSQFIPTAYCALVVLSIRWPDAEAVLEGKYHGETSFLVQSITHKVRCIFYIGFFLNAPLLPTYPFYVQHTSLSLGVVNALLHLNLTVAWGMQAKSLCLFCKAFNLVERDEKKDE